MLKRAKKKKSVVHLDSKIKNPSPTQQWFSEYQKYQQLGVEFCTAQMCDVTKVLETTAETLLQVHHVKDPKLSKAILEIKSKYLDELRADLTRLPVSIWGVEHVALFLHNHPPLDAYIDSFFLQEVTGAKLLDYCGESLEDLGMKALGHRKRLCSQLSPYRTSSSPSSVRKSPPHSPVTRKKSLENARVRSCDNITISSSISEPLVLGPEWDEKEVYQWLLQTFPQEPGVAEIIFKNHVTGNMFPFLNDSTLRSYGIAQLGIRRRLLRATKQYCVECN